MRTLSTLQRRFDGSSPLSETHDNLADGTVIIDQTKWLFPSTDLRCSDGILKTEHQIEITYSRRKSTALLTCRLSNRSVDMSHHSAKRNGES
jgi:hypothetical protein